MILFGAISLRSRIFMTMVFLVIISSILMAGISVIQFEKTNEEYHFSRFSRKATTIKSRLDYIISQYAEKVTPENVVDVLADRIFELSDINRMDIYVYDIGGDFLISSSPSIDSITQIPDKILKEIRANNFAQVDFSNINQRGVSISSYSYIFNKGKDPVAILRLPYFPEDNTFLLNKMEQFLEQVGFIYLFLLISAIILAYYLSKGITKTLTLIKESLSSTTIGRQNPKLQYAKNDEIRPLVDAYNQMVIELEKTSKLLIKSEKENAWREMAKQVAHEIKNPLTPMRLMVQSFAIKINKSIDLKKDIQEFSLSMTQQIDTLSSIASAFSEFANMPTHNDEEINFDQVVERTLEIFDQSYLIFNSGASGIILFMDKARLVRVITNLVNNALQSVPSTRKPKIIVSSSFSVDKVILTIKDNGKGILPELQKPIFDPHFTTKSGGTGLGLSIVKRIIQDYKGRIYFESQLDIGTTFFVELPIIDSHYV